MRGVAVDESYVRGTSPCRGSGQTARTFVALLTMCDFMSQVKSWQELPVDQIGVRGWLIKLFGSVPDEVKATYSECLSVWAMLVCADHGGRARAVFSMAALR